MKRCPYCGKEYSDEYSVCPIDENPLESTAAKPIKKQSGILVCVLLVLIVGFDCLIDPHFFSHFFSLKNIRLLFCTGLLVLITLVSGIFWLRTRCWKRRLDKAMKEALAREAREQKREMGNSSRQFPKLRNGTRK